MTSLVAMLSTGKGTWSQVIKLINTQEWDSIYLITNQFGKENFKTEKKVNLIILNSRDIKEMRNQLLKELDGKLEGDVAVNFVSGAGDEHMALVTALIKLGIGIRFIIPDKEGIEEL